MNEIECLHCPTRVYGETLNLSVQEMRKHVRRNHPDKPQI